MREQESILTGSKENSKEIHVPRQTRNDEMNLDMDEKRVCS